MHRIDTAGAANNRFNDGDELAGRQGTVVDAAWLNAIQEEIASTVEGLGTDPLEKGQNGQLLAVIRALRKDIIDNVLPNAILEARKADHPVGKVVIFRGDSRNPATILGFGAWVATAQGRAIVGAGSNGWSLYSDGERYGAERVTLSIKEMPRHRHSVPSPSHTEGDSGGANFADANTNDTVYSSYEGQGYSHENRQPSEAFYVWRRTA